MNEGFVKRYFKDGETAQKTLEQLGLFEQVGKQYILTADINWLSFFLEQRPDECWSITTKEQI